MQIRCHSCELDCTVDERSAETAACPRCGSVLVSPPAGTARMADAGSESSSEVLTTRHFRAASPSPPAYPWRWGRYSILAPLGKGGFGTVYRARDELLGRELALKVPRVERCRTPAHVDDMLAEARKVAGLDHAGIVTVYEVGILPEAIPFVPLDQIENEAVRQRLSQGIPFIAMKFIEGGSLDRRMLQRPYSADEAARLVARLAEAMGRAHQKGLVHRDLKPNNVLLDAQGQPHIIDFGLAVEEDTQLNLPTGAPGTLEYMSPEQLLGQAGWLDARCDIWALGVVLYELLTGKRPFRGTVEQIRDQILYREPKPPRQTNPAIPSELEAICLKCLSKDVKGRYNTAEDLAAALNGFSIRPGTWLRSDVSDSAGYASPVSNSPKTPEAGRRVEGAKPPRRPKLWAAAGVGGLFFALGLTLIPNQRETGPWRNLLVKVPAMELKSTLLPTEVLHLDPRSGRLLLGNQYPALCTLGELSSDNVTIRMSFSKQTWSGWTGVFLVGHHDHREPMEPAMEFEAIGIHSFQPAGQLQQHRIERKRFRASSSPPQNNPMIEEDVLISSADVEIPFATDADLELQFRVGRLIDVRWMGVRYPALDDSNPQNSLSNSGCRGKVGILHLQGDVNVAEFKIRVADAVLPSDSFVEPVR